MKKTRSPAVTAASAEVPNEPTAMMPTKETLEKSRLVATAGSASFQMSSSTAGNSAGEALARPGASPSEAARSITSASLGAGDPGSTGGLDMDSTVTAQ